MNIYAQNGTIATLTNGSHTDNLNYFFISVAVLMTFSHYA